MNPTAGDALARPRAAAPRAWASAGIYPLLAFALTATFSPAAAALSLTLSPGPKPSQGRGFAGTSAPYVTHDPGRGRFPLAVAGQPVPLHVDSQDFAGVIRAAGDLRADLGRVTGAEPRLVVGGMPASGRVVLIGTLGRSPTIDALVRAGKLDVRGVAGRWETFLLQAVRQPLPGVEEALVIAGSDRRGTIYGIYDLSSAIGVSPWYWWADVPVRRQSSLYVLPGRHTDGEPAVRYRGIFINDEAPALSGWAREKFGGFNHEFYVKVFELILRLKGNYLWPAMWGNAFNADDTLNPKLADEYGVVMGTSHHEPMLRAQQEWKRFGHGPWNYEQNDSVLRAFWADGIRHMGSHESIVTVGMRGDGDMPMTQNANIALLERIVADQRKIIAQVTGKPAPETPQLWALYKEVQDYYDRGMRVPDDVTLLFSDDNWGNIRRLPTAKDRGRAGGFGIYYHFDYVGGPRNYKWIDTNPIARIQEQMNLAYRYGANRIWIVNVGDIKPMEYPISFFLDFAWNPDRWPADRLPEYARQWATQQFTCADPGVRSGDLRRADARLRFRDGGNDCAAEIGDIVTTTLQYAARRKPELLTPETYSLINYREAERVLADYRALEARAEGMATRLPAEYRDAYYQLVLHPSQAAANLNALYVTVGRNRLYALQGRAATNELADSARALFQRDAAISRFYNDSLAGGKWRHMMDQTHIGYTYWQEPPRNVMPRVDVIQVPVPAEMGVAFEGQEQPLPGGAPSPAPPRDVLPALEPTGERARVIEIYDRGQTPFDFTATAAEPWVLVTPSQGRIEKQQELTVSVDWSRAPAGEHRVPITIAGAGQRVVVQALVRNLVPPGDAADAGFVESDGVVSMEAEHYTRAVGAGGVGWQRIPGLGRTLSGMEATPVTAPAGTPGGHAPRLEYRVQLYDTGNVKVHAYISPTWDFTGGTGLRYAVSFDDDTPKIVNIHADGSSTGKTDGNRAWEQGVADAVKILVSDHHIAHPGTHVLKFWRVDPGIVLQKLVIDAGGLRASYLGPPESGRTTGMAKERPQGQAQAFTGTAQRPQTFTGTGTRTATGNGRGDRPQAQAFTGTGTGSFTFARSAVRPQAPPDADPRFDWFDYVGHDPVYETVNAAPGGDSYLNPVLAGFYPDPSVVRAGDDYYLVTSSFAWFPGVPIFRSRDLVDWTQIGHVLDRPSQLDLDGAGISRGIFAPTIRFHDGTFYVITTLVDRGGNFYVTAKDPAGPWSDPVWLPEIDGIDPSLFFDDDGATGRAYVVNNGPPIGKPLYDGHRALWLQELDLSKRKLVGPRRLIVNGGTDLSKKPIWIEAPHILKVRGKYFLIAAEGGTAEQHSEVVFRSESLWGPWEPYSGNPILTQRHLDPARPFPVSSTGHADFVQTPAGEWWAVFLGTRPYKGEHFNTGRETFLLPVDWHDEWPVILSGTATVPYAPPRPALPAGPPPKPPTSGNFSFRENFDAPALPFYWEMMRTPRGPAFYDLAARPGWLTLRARTEPLGGRGQPSFLGRRQQHAHASVSTVMAYSPARPGDMAGLAAFHNETHYYALGVTLAGGRPTVVLERHAGGLAGSPGEIVASAPLRSPASPVYLRIDARGALYDFYFGRKPGEWTLLARDVDGTVLSTRVAGGFVGTMLGPFAVRAP